MTIFVSFTHQILRTIRVTNSNMRWVWHVPRMWRNMLRKFKENEMGMARTTHVEKYAAKI